VSFEKFFSAGDPLSKTVGLQGAQRAEVTGMQGMGVRAPRAAVVAAASVGLARLKYMPGSIKFIMGTWSSMLAAIILRLNTGLGVGNRLIGAMPCVHCITAPMEVLHSHRSPPRQCLKISARVEVGASPSPHGNRQDRFMSLTAR
jgi:hypothetical protein